MGKAMKLPILILSVTAVFWLSGCSGVLLKEPLAATTAEDLQEDLEGTWFTEDGSLRLAFTEAGQGEIAYIERKEDAFQMERGEIAAVARDERLFLSIRFEEEGELPEEYYLAEYQIGEYQNLIVWMPDMDRFEEAVGDGTLVGEIEKQKYGTTVRLTATPEAILDYLEANPQSMETRKPLIFRKLQ